jgi:gliding motility-associated-like protein
MKAPKKFGAFIFLLYICPMKKLIALLLLANIGYSQYCPALGPDQLLPCGVGSTTLTADLSQCGTGTNPNQTTNYTVGNIPYVSQTNTGTQLFMADDTQQGPFNIGFNFCFFGQTYTQFWIGSNGWISFSPGQPITFTTQTIPTGNALVPKNCIMGPWQDWHPGIGGQIRYQTVGVAPCRKLIVSWTNVPMYSCTLNQGTFHIVIYESSNYIENYIQNKPACLQWQNGTATQGIHNNMGTIGIAVPGRNSSAWTTTNDAWRWTPSGPTVNPILVWYQVGVAAPLGTGNTINVTPPQGGAQYTCHLQYPTCNAGWNVCNNNGVSIGPDTVLVVPGYPIPSTGPINGLDTICYLSSNETYSVPLNPAYNYLWSTVGSLTSGQGTNQITIDFSSFSSGFIPGAIQVTPEENGCVGLPVSFDVYILNVLPVIDPIGPFCEYDGSVTLNATPVGGVFSGNSIGGNTFTPGSAVGTNILTYTYTQSGCVFDTTTTVIVNPQPILDSITPYNPFYELCEGDSVNLIFTALSNLSGYNEWSFMGLTYQQDNLNISFESPGMFPISVVHYSNGCVSNIQETVVTIARCPELLFYVPNSFTPDGNEHNNVFQPVFTNGFDPFDFHLEIYNRWGEMLFESYNHTEYWDGTYNNTPCPVGSYTYKIQFGFKETDNDQVVSGNVNLIR